MPALTSIVIPVYNEAENILKTLSEIKEHVRIPYEILIVYDLDSDTTLPALASLLKTNTTVRTVKNQYGRGALNAIKTGFHAAEGDCVAVVMADLSDQVSRINDMREKIQDGYDLVCGSRYMKGGAQIGGPAFKKFLSKCAGLSLHYLAGVPSHDVSNSFKMYRKSLLNQITIESNGGFELGMEILIKAWKLGYKITEVPSTWTDRSAGESRFQLWKWLPKYLKWYFFALGFK